MLTLVLSKHQERLEIGIYVNILPRYEARMSLHSDAAATSWCRAAYIIPAALFIVLAIMLTTQPTIPFDQVVAGYIATYRNLGLTHLMRVLTDAGSSPAIILAAISLLGILIPKRMYDAAIFAIVSIVGVGLLNVLLKSLFQRPRPPEVLQLAIEHGYSFPSGHSMASSGLAIIMLYLVWQTKWRYPLLGVGLAYTFAVGLSRVYLGVHYPTDIIAGWCASWLLVTFAAYWILSGRARIYFSRSRQH